MRAETTGDAGAAARQAPDLGTAWAFRALNLSRDATRADAKRAYHRCATACEQMSAHSALDRARKRAGCVVGASAVVYRRGVP